MLAKHRTADQNQKPNSQLSEIARGRNETAFVVCHRMHPEKINDNYFIHQMRDVNMITLCKLTCNFISDVLLLHETVSFG